MRIHGLAFIQDYTAAEQPAAYRRAAELAEARVPVTMKFIGETQDEKISRLGGEKRQLERDLAAAKRPKPKPRKKTAKKKAKSN